MRLYRAPAPELVELVGPLLHAGCKRGRGAEEVEVAGREKRPRWVFGPGMTASRVMQLYSDVKGGVREEGEVEEEEENENWVDRRRMWRWWMETMSGGM